VESFVIASQTARNGQILYYIPLYYTSQLYGIGKGALLKKFRSSKNFPEQAEVFYIPSATPKDIIAVGEQALVTFYKEKHWTVYVTNAAFLHLETLPPTSAAAKYLCIVHLQVKVWKGHGSEFQPLEWEGKECDGTCHCLLI